MHATCPVRIIFLDATTFMTFYEKYKLWSSSLCKFLYPIVLNPSILTLISIATRINLYLYSGDTQVWNPVMTFYYSS
jgi:hypothetical protein